MASRPKGERARESRESMGNRWPWNCTVSSQSGPTSLSFFDERECYLKLALKLSPVKSSCILSAPKVGICLKISHELY